MSNYESVALPTELARQQRRVGTKPAPPGEQASNPVPGGPAGAMLDGFHSLIRSVGLGRWPDRDTFGGFHAEAAGNAEAWILSACRPASLAPIFPRMYVGCSWSWRLRHRSHRPAPRGTGAGASPEKGNHPATILRASCDHRASFHRVARPLSGRALAEFRPRLADFRPELAAFWPFPAEFRPRLGPH